MQTFVQKHRLSFFRGSLLKDSSQNQARLPISGPVPDGHTLEDKSVHADPDVRADGYAAIQLKGRFDVPRLGGPVRVEIGIRDHAVRPHHRVLADGNGA